MTLNDSYSFDPNDGCQDFKLMESDFFFQMPAPAAKDFDAIKRTAMYARRDLLFAEGQRSLGVYLLCDGRVKLTVSSANGTAMIARIAGPGELLGVIAALARQPYEVTAEAIDLCHVTFVGLEDFLRFLHSHLEAFQNVMKQAMFHYRNMCEQLRMVGRPAPAKARLARLLLAWSEAMPQVKRSSQIKLPLTHEEIAEFIGTSRETVTRTLSDFRVRHLVAIQGSTLTIPNRAALENFARL